MTALVDAGRRVLPRGYADFARQLAIWFGFYILYQLARGAADRDAAAAFDNGLKVIDVERRFGDLWELSLQGFLGSSHLLIELTSWTYWLSQFAVLGLALLWVYLRRNEHFLRFRDTVLVANLIGLVGYVLLPTAPPRMFPDFGFVDTLARFSSVNHSSAAIEFASNPYAAMPSLHAADALIVGVVMAGIVRWRPAKVLWLAWPAWVAFAVMATGNHFWLDIAAGAVVAGAAALVVRRYRRVQRA
ncbi:MAG TPA: phosphatase PAP2 family protein [Gaiellaceae bacterium]|nr:phosphatase PAP2 family protein [Gaiellaceae bacterium]